MPTVEGFGVFFLILFDMKMFGRVQKGELFFTFGHTKRRRYWNLVDYDLRQFDN